MNFEDAKNDIRGRWREIMPRITSQARNTMNGERSWICPKCGQGTHKGYGLTFIPAGHRDPLTGKTSDGNTLKCFDCGFTGDIFQLYQEVHGADFVQAVKALADMLNITIDDAKPYQRPPEADFVFERLPDDQQDSKPLDPPQNGNLSPSAAYLETGGYSDYYKRCRNDLSAEAAQAYLKRRGISPATAAAVGIGYDNNADPACNPAGIPGKSMHPTARIIIPTGPLQYVAKAISPDIAPQYKNMNPKGSGAGIFNLHTLFAPEVIEDIFITEGAFDALSLLEIGRQAIALNSTSNARQLAGILKENPIKDKTLILCLDNDDAGRTASKVLSEELQALEIPHIVANVCGEHKDPNEALTADRGAFIAAVEAAEHEAGRKPDNVAYYINSGLLDRDIKDFGDSIPTGYPNLDKLIGGLYPGLYCLAAISSLGKTTFCHQMADQIAAAGYEVLFFALEQSRLEMVTKSLAREMAKIDDAAALSSLEIRKGWGYRADHPEVTIINAKRNYLEAVGDRVSIIEGNFRCDISFIGNKIRHYCQLNHARPVVIIDYLQLLQPEIDDRGRIQGTKETMDKAITTLKQLSRQLNITIIVISSVNRANYMTPISFESIKESGGIEYTCDVVWGLQLECLHDPIFASDSKTTVTDKRQQINKAKAEDPRRIELVGLKNRFGKASCSCLFSYYSEYDWFLPILESPYQEEFEPRRQLRARK